MPLSLLLKYPPSPHWNWSCSFWCHLQSLSLCQNGTAPASGEEWFIILNLTVWGLVLTVLMDLDSQAEADFQLTEALVRAVTVPEWPHATTLVSYAGPGGDALFSVVASLYSSACPSPGLWRTSQCFWTTQGVDFRVRLGSRLKDKDQASSWLGLPEDLADDWALCKRT